MAKSIPEQLEEIGQEQQSIKATLADFIKGAAVSPEALKAAEQKAKDAESKSADLEAKLKAKDEEIAKLKGELEAANKAKDEAVKAKADAEAAAVKAKEDAAKELSDKEASVEKRAGIKAQAIEAKRGVTEPVAEERKDDPAGKAKSGLTGFAKVQAAIESDLAKN